MGGDVMSLAGEMTPYFLSAVLVKARDEVAVRWWGEAASCCCESSESPSGYASAGTLTPPGAIRRSAPTGTRASEPGGVR